MTHEELQTFTGSQKGLQSPFLSGLKGLSTLLDWSGRVIAALSLSFIFVTLLVNVTLRYVFGSGIAWAYEIHALLLPWLVGGGIVVAAARGRNIAITLLPFMLTPKSRRILSLVISVVIFAIAVGVLDSGAPILKASKFQTLSTLGIKQFWGYLSLFYAFACMAVIAVVDIVRVLAGEDYFALEPENTSLS